MKNKEEMIQDEVITKVNAGYKEGDIIHDYCPWCQCEATGVFNKDNPSEISGYVVKMTCSSCGKTFYHGYR